MRPRTRAAPGRTPFGNPFSTRVVAPPAPASDATHDILQYLQ